MNQQNSLNFIATVMCLCVSLVFFATSSAEVFAQESKNRLTVGISPWGVGIDSGRVVFMLGGDFDFRRWGSDETAVEISPRASLKLFLNRAELSPYFEGSISNRLEFDVEERDISGSTSFAGVLGLEYSKMITQNIRLGWEVGLRFSYYHSTRIGSSTRVGSHHDYTLRFIF